MPLIKAAIAHKGAAFIDVISPCVAFNNHAGSTKSFDYVREHNEAVNRLDFITGRDADQGGLRAGHGRDVEQHDGSKHRVAQARSRITMSMIATPRSRICSRAGGG